MLNLIVNIVWGFICQTIYFAGIFNKFKGKKYISTYFIFLVSYIIGMISQNFTYDHIYIAYIVIATVFSILYAIIHKIKYKITDMLLMLNTILISSILTGIPILFVGYNKIYFIINVIEIIILFIIFMTLPLNKLYNFIVPNWNRTNNNKIKSITLRNFIMISCYLSITLINIFLNEVFLNIYQKLL